MKRRTLALALACALSLSLLTACGGGAGSSAGQSSQSGSVSSGADQSGAGSGASSSSPDASQPGNASQPGDASSAGGSSSSAEEPDASQPEQAGLILNRTDFSLFTVGSKFQLKAAGVPQGASVTWTSSDPQVASVAEDGTVTYVAAGSATITASAGELTAACKVYCKAQEAQEPEDGDTSAGDGDGSAESGSGESSQVDLEAFYASVSAAYDFPSSMQLADAAVQDMYYPGLTNITTEQCLVYANMMSMNMGELVLVQVADSADVDPVKAILQTRIDNMINGGAWYPEPTRIWSECSQVVSNGNYVMMVVGESYASVVSDFNALF